MKPRTIRLRNVWLQRSGKIVTVHGSTAGGNSYSIEIRLEGSDAVCAIGTLSSIVQEEIVEQRSNHEYLTSSIEADANKTREKLKS